jgi:hypothetical protein
MAYKVFISSTNKDLELAKDLARRLKEMGIKVFSVTEGSVAGERIDTTTKEGLRDADEVFVILTNNSVNSPGLMAELGAAVSLGKRVTPVALGVDYTNLPPMVTDQYIRYADLPKYLSYLEKRARQK